MYSSYSSLQQSQLAAQGYYDTQSTYLLVYAPGRNTALRATLADQLHRKFRLADTLGSALTEGVDGVLLVSEDVECMSTALMCFAKALQDGADYAVCNAVFGFGGPRPSTRAGPIWPRTAAPSSAAPCWSAAAPPPRTPKTSQSCWRWLRSSAPTPPASHRLCSTTSGTSAPRMRSRPRASGLSS